MSESCDPTLHFFQEQGFCCKYFKSTEFVDQYFGFTLHNFRVNRSSTVVGIQVLMLNNIKMRFWQTVHNISNQRRLCL